MLKKAHVHMTSGALALLGAIEAGTNVLGTALNEDGTGMGALPVILLGISAGLASFVQVYEASEVSKDSPPDA